MTDSSSAEKSYIERDPAIDAAFPYALADNDRNRMVFSSGYRAGHASRDAEVAELRQAQQEQWYRNDVTLATENAALREQLAKAEAVIEKAAEKYLDRDVFDAARSIYDILRPAALGSGAEGKDQ